ncbi:MAG: hypothetical protein ABIV47_08435, partial [Roseiflexaceae bacterium]
GERNRERVFRERARPWSEDERWTLRRRVWRERRDRERELLEQREQTLEQREQELARLRAQLDRWLADVALLEPDMHEWCAERARLSADAGITPALLDQVYQRRRQVAEYHAREVFARADVRAALGAAIGAAGRDSISFARAITPPLVALDSAACASAASSDRGTSAVIMRAAISARNREPTIAYHSLFFCYEIAI